MRNRRSYAIKWPKHEVKGFKEARMKSKGVNENDATRWKETGSVYKVSVRERKRVKKKEGKEKIKPGGTNRKKAGRKGTVGGGSPVRSAERAKRWPHGVVVREGSAPRSVIIASGRGN